MFGRRTDTHSTGLARKAASMRFLSSMMGSNHLKNRGMTSRLATQVPLPPRPDVGHAHDPRSAVPLHGGQHGFGRVGDECAGPPVSLAANAQAVNHGPCSLHTALDIGHGGRAAGHHDQARVSQRHPGGVTHQSGDFMALRKRLPDHEPTGQSGGTKDGDSRHWRHHRSTEGRRSSSKVQASLGCWCSHQ
jgi:hypothetical protein